MKSFITHSFALVLPLTLAISPLLSTAQTTQPFLPGKVRTMPIPDEFVDPETHLRVVHLSRFANDYSGVIYFTYNTFSADSHLTLIDEQFKDKWRHLYTFDFASMSIAPLITDRLTQNQVVVARVGQRLFRGRPWRLGGPVNRRRLAQALRSAALAGGRAPASLSTPTKRCCWAVRPTSMNPLPALQAKAGIPGCTPEVLFTVDLKTGQLKVIHRDNRWLGHVQFSPTDPDLLHVLQRGQLGKGGSHLVHQPLKIIDRREGQRDFQRPRRLSPHRTPRDRRARILAARWQADLVSAKLPCPPRTRRSPDLDGTSPPAKSCSTKFRTALAASTRRSLPTARFLIADGSGAKGDTKPGPDKYISRLTLPTDGANVLKGEHLVTLHANDYAVEPNPHVSPDNRWVIFTATLHGTAQAYAVELPKQNQ